MEHFAKVRDILVDILDLEEQDISLESYVIRELGAESIDLLELAVTLNSNFKIEINDDQIFFHHLRHHLESDQAADKNAEAIIRQQYPFLASARIQALLKDLQAGPILKVQDLVSYISWRQGVLP